ncbi:hypothetical protein E7744_13675 [Citricoccus sp. SGAir0253]|uniref:anti-sigma factor n=1 Tax=Citricoccus sp. SGAir0253 TaxID=2567881 RepID=UPI0010CCBA46|nr:anti-sigma factor [Citricoccus sp. SGAir0253]QCU79063.1 hypothetical protein E7744_13675 [Citricoccus sp. SGAir0253]
MAETTERHLTEDDLASIATGAAPGAAVAAHLLACPPCREDLARTERAVAALAAPVELHEPPAGLWEAIERDLGTAFPDPSPLRPLPGDDRPAPRPGGAGAAGPEEGGSVSFLPRANRRRWPVIAAAAAAGLVVGAAGAALVTAALTGDDGGNGTPQGPVAVGEAVLDPVTAADVAGRAEMVSEPDGGLRLTVDVSKLPESGYYEVWLRDEEASRLISLGTVTATTTTLPVPSGVDLARFPVVDVSQEDFDGNPAHSGVTLAAGPMTRTGDATAG